MNTRQPIQPSNIPAVLSLAFSTSRNRFIAGLSSGLQVFRTDNCLTTYRPTNLSVDGGLAIAEALDDRYIAFVAGGRSRAGSQNVVVFWDCLLEKEVSRFDFYEPVLGMRLNGKWMCVVLRERTVVFEYQELRPSQRSEKPVESDSEDETRTDGGENVEETLKGPNKAKSLHQTASNPFALASLRNDTLILPAQTVGQIQLVPLVGGSKRVLRAHNTALRCLALSPSGSLLATASEQGTLIRVFDVKTLDQIAEFRRGVEKAIIFGLAFSDGGRWLAATSDKGTVHLFDLRPTSPASVESPTTAHYGQQPRSSQQHRKTASHPAPRLSSGTMDKDSLVSGRSSPSTATYQGSIQEYYGLRPPPSSASPTGKETAVHALSAFRNSAFAPRFMKDVRSVASLPFYMGNDPPHWQGGASYSWTTAPGGTRKRVRNAVPPLPGEPSGRPVKGVLAFAPAAKDAGRSEDDGVVLYVIGGGSDARWEIFELLPAEGGGWVLINRGFRKYLTRQFVD